MQVNVYSKKNEYNSKVSAHFKVREFACKDGSEAIFISQKLVLILEEIRKHFGKPIVINSGFRTATHNKKVGGSPTSQHLYGLAADIKVSGVAPKDVADYARSIMKTYGGVGRYSTFTHIDVRDTVSNWKG